MSELVKRCWSGKRGKMTVAEIDLRVGGRWRYVMVTERGFEVAFHGEFREIVTNERIVSTEICKEERDMVMSSGMNEEWSSSSRSRSRSAERPAQRRTMRSLRAVVVAFLVGPEVRPRGRYLMVRSRGRCRRASLVPGPR